MDQSNLRNLKLLQPAQGKAELDLFLRRYDGVVDEVPDPYYDEEHGFEQVLDLIEQACDRLVPGQRTQGAPMSLQPQADVSLKPYNSFGVDVRAQWFAEARDDDDVREALAFAAQRQLPLLVVGGGSNLLLTADIQALVLRMGSRGIRLLSDDGQRVVVEAEAGEPWHPFVLSTLEQGWYGLENLSLIPGTVGAAPMQNIGAYGVEIKDVFAGLTALERRASCASFPWNSVSSVIATACSSMPRDAG